MRKFVAGILLFLVCLGAVHAQDDQEWFWDKPIADITFRGLVSVSKNDLDGIIKPYIGRNFTDSLFMDVQSKLYALDYFEEITPIAVPANPEKTSVIVEFQVVERPLIISIEFLGNEKLRRNELLETILLKEQEMVTPAKVQIDEAALRDKYIEKGFPNVQVSSEIREEEKGTVVVFTISEGEQLAIKEIKFSGNSFASAGTLKDVMKSKEQSFFNSGVYQENYIALDKEMIRNYYTGKGYIDASVTDFKTETVSSDKDGRKYLALTFYIDEGKQYTFSGITFEGNKVFSEAQLREKLRMAPGRVLDLQQLEKDLSQIADLYYDNGYIFNTFDPQAVRNESDKTISYILTIGEKDRAHIENILVKGNDRTLSEVILREIPLEPGDLFSKAKIFQGIQSLWNLQYFSNVAPEFEPGSAEGLMNLIVNVEETNTATVNFGINFSGDPAFPLAAFVNLSDKNFLGKGQTLGGELNLSPVNQSLSFNFLENWLFKQRISAGVSFTISHKLVSSITQDLLPPIFSNGTGTAVPDPYDGHYVFTDDQKYLGKDYKAGDTFPIIPTAADIETYHLKTDYVYAQSKGETIPSHYLMSYDSWDFGLGFNGSYEHKLPYGSIITSAGIQTSLGYLTYDDGIFRPFEAEQRTNLNKWLFVNKFNIALAWDTRDFRFNPQSGFLLSQQFTYAGGILFGTQNYIRAQSKAEGFFTLFDIPVTDGWNFKSVFGAHSAVTFILPQFGKAEPETPLTNLLMIDGMFNARGWRPNLYGRAMWDNWIELRFPIAEQLLWFDLFADAAALWNTPADMGRMKISDFYFSVGADLRIVMPTFPIRLGLAKLFQFDENGNFIKGPGDIWKDGLGLQFVIGFSTSLF